MAKKSLAPSPKSESKVIIIHQRNRKSRRSGGKNRLQIQHLAAVFDQNKRIHFSAIQPQLSSKKARPADAKPIKVFLMVD